MSFEEFWLRERVRECVFEREREGITKCLFHVPVSKPQYIDVAYRFSECDRK